MSALALFELLQDFGKSPVRAAEPGRTPEPPRKAASPVFSPSNAAPDYSDMISAEVARAEAALTERLTAEHAIEMEAERLRHATEMEEVLHRFGQEAGATIAAGIAEMEARVTELTTTATARIVGGILSEDIQKRSLEALALSIKTATADPEAVRIRVSGPQSLFEALRAAMPEREHNFDYVEAPGFDLTVTIDGDIFETRIAEWSTAISEILA